MRKARRRIEPAFAARAYDDVRAARVRPQGRLAILCAVLAAARSSPMRCSCSGGRIRRRSSSTRRRRVRPPPAVPAANVPRPTARSRPAAASASGRQWKMRNPPVKVADAASRKIRRARAAPGAHDPLPEANVARRPTRSAKSSRRRPGASPPCSASLAEYGYGQIKPTGILDRETQDAIEKFERAQKAAGDPADPPVLMRELAALAAGRWNRSAVAPPTARAYSAAKPALEPCASNPESGFPPISAAAPSRALPPSCAGAARTKPARCSSRSTGSTAPPIVRAGAADPRSTTPVRWSVPSWPACKRSRRRMPTPKAISRKQLRFDPDLWIVEVEDRAGRNFLDRVVT